NEEYNVENLQPGFGLLLVLVERFEQATDREGHRPEHLCRANNDVTEQAGNAISDELGGQSDEHTGCMARVAAVVQLLHGQRFGGQSRLRCRGGHQGNGGMFLGIKRPRFRRRPIQPRRGMAYAMPSPRT
ncbi:hypothetical protein T310_9781, partial [Rasamsonia emersonii CBS 393.64]